MRISLALPASLVLGLMAACGGSDAEELSRLSISTKEFDKDPAFSAGGTERLEATRTKMTEALVKLSEDPEAMGVVRETLAKMQNLE